LRARAVANAKDKAVVYAGGASAKLGRLISINPQVDPQDQGNVESSFAGGVGRALAEPAAAPAAIPIEPGVITLSASVSVTWELLPE
jgi:uncharacterized protein YggE